ncbi:Broad-complex core protein isoform 6 [Caligus rogercresseyi]|uniref:Broad-complex core protein isoform 6 n=1 Tax=Caligus rogercresseyi TaxID=217165 RepID=A0A7T8JX02_CALRO|nr:Broad-complex core protein isoform 6 [Caligus rogercresseyi]
MACRKRFKVTSSPSSVKRHLLICRRGAFYKTEDKLSYAAAARRGDFMSEQNFDF